MYNIPSSKPNKHYKFKMSYHLHNQRGILLVYSKFTTIEELEKCKIFQLQNQKSTTSLKCHNATFQVIIWNCNFHIYIFMKHISEGNPLGASPNSEDGT
jgi:hypothetical protein